MRLPDRYRRENRVHLDIIASAWPELLEFPFNQGVPVPSFRRQRFRAAQLLERRTGRVGRIWRRAIRQPRWVMERLGLGARPSGDGASFRKGKENNRSET